MNIFDLSATLRLDSKDYEKGLTESESKAKTFGGKLKSALKIGAGAAVATTTAIIGVGAAIKKGITATSAYGDKVDKMSQKIGISSDAYQKWDYVMARAGGNVDSLKMGMKTLSQQAEKNSDAFQKLGISQEEVANSSQEELFEKTVRGLAGMEQGTERAALASQLLGRAGADMGPLLNGGTEAIDEQMKIAEEYGMVMPKEAVAASAAFEDSMTTMQMTATGLRNRLMGQLLPAATKVTDGLALLFKGDMKGADKVGEGVQEIANKIMQALPKIMQVGGKILGGIANAIIQNLPQLTNTAVQIVLSLVRFLIQAAPKIIEAGIKMINELMIGLSQALPRLIPAIVKGVVMMVQALIQNAPMLIQGGIALIQGLVTGLINALPQLVNAIPTLVEAIVNGILNNLPKIVIAGLKLVVALAGAIIKNIPKIVVAVLKLAIKIPATIIKAVPKMLSAGVKLIKNVWNGIKSWFSNLPKNLGAKMKQVPSKVGSFVGSMLKKGIELIKGVWNGIKDWFSNLPKKLGDKMKQIPEKVKEFVQDMFDAGVNLVKGLWNGIKSWWKNLTKHVKENSQGLGATTRRAFKIKSPSRVFMEIGKNVSLGMAIGIENGWSAVDSAMSGMNDIVQNGVEDIDDINDIDMGYTNGAFEESISIAMGDVVGRAMSNLVPYMQSAMLEAMDGIAVEMDKRQMGRMVRKAVKA